MEIKISDLVRTTRRYMKDGTEKTEIKDDIHERSFSETGRGTMQPVAEAAPAVAAQGQGDSAPSAPTAAPSKKSTQDPFFETEMILKQVIQSGPVVQ